MSNDATVVQPCATDHLCHSLLGLALKVPKPQKHLAVRHLLKIDMSAQSTTSQLKRHFVSVRSKGGSTQ